MEPTVARIIHLTGASINRYDTDPKHCIAGIITKIGKENLFITAFPWHGPEASRRVMVKTADTAKWHDPRECSNATTAEPAST